MTAKRRIQFLPSEADSGYKKSSHTRGAWEGHPISLRGHISSDMRPGGGGLKVSETYASI